jgi:hypothetical protein
MNLWERFKVAWRDQRGQFDFGGFGDFGSGLGNIDITGGDLGGGGDWFGPGAPISVGPVAGGGNWWSGLSNALGGFGDFARNLSPYLGLGTAGLGAASSVLGALQSGRQSKLAEGAAKQEKILSQQAQTAAAPIAGFSAEQLQLAQQGQIPPAIQAQINQWKQAAKQQAADFAARTGQGDSTTLQSWYQWIDQQAQAMQASALQNMEQLGIQAGGTAGGILGQAMQGASAQGNLAGQNAGGIEALIAAANQVLSRLNAAAT